VSNKYRVIILAAALLILALMLSGCGLLERPAYADVGNTSEEPVAAFDGSGTPNDSVDHNFGSSAGSNSDTGNNADTGNNTNSGNNAGLYSNNRFFFPGGVPAGTYSASFIQPDGISNIFQGDMNLNVRLVRTWEDASLYWIYLEPITELDSEGRPSQLDPERLQLGLFLVYEDAIYKTELYRPTWEYVVNIADNLQAGIETYHVWTVASSEVPDSDECDITGMRSEVIVEAGTTFYFYKRTPRYVADYSHHKVIIWKENEGIVFYENARSQWRQHVSFWSDAWDNRIPRPSWDVDGCTCC